MNKYIWVFLFLGMMFLTGCSSSGEVMTVEENKSGSLEKHEADEVEQSSAEGSDSGTDCVSQNVDGKGSVQGEGLEGTIYVYVCGHVETPGVYQLPAEARVCDALQLAGGVTEDGNPEALNQAECMTDGQTLYVPGLDENVDVAGMTQQSKEDGLININQADREMLMTLPGIGESKADMIIQYREEHGNFQSIEELMDIPGIKEGVFNKMKEKITCR